MIRFVLAIFFLVHGMQLSMAQLITYKAPVGSLLNNDYKVAVSENGKSWQSLPTYLAQVAKMDNGLFKPQNSSLSYFDFEGKAEVAITYLKGPVKTVKIRPLAAGILPVVKGNRITFSLNAPQNLSIEVNGDIFHNLQLFANEIEKNKPSASDTSVIYFGPGVHAIGTLKVPSNKKVYVAGGAVVIGKFVMSKVENVRISGRGIVTQQEVQPEHYKDIVRRSGIRQTGRADQFTIEYSRNVTIEGLNILPYKYTVLIGQSRGVTIKNIKSLSSSGNADGIDVFSSSDVILDGLFMRNSDDCIAIYGHRWNYFGNLKNVTVKNSTLWADVAHPLLIGTHGDTPDPDTLEHINFTNIDILDQHESQIDYQGCLALNAGDNNLIRNIVFDQIRVEKIRKGQLVNMRIMYNKKYNTSPGRGIENVLFRNVSYNGPPANLSIISGYDATRSIKKVVFENFIVNGTLITDSMPNKPGFYKTGDMANIFVGEHVNDIRFIPLQNRTSNNSPN